MRRYYPTSALDVEAVKNSIRDATNLRGDVVLVASSALANDERVIEDCWPRVKK